MGGACSIKPPPLLPAATPLGRGGAAGAVAGLRVTHWQDGELHEEAGQLQGGQQVGEGHHPGQARGVLLAEGRALAPGAPGAGGSLHPGLALWGGREGSGRRLAEPWERSRGQSPGAVGAGAESPGWRRAGSEGRGQRPALQTADPSPGLSSRLTLESRPPQRLNTPVSCTQPPQDRRGGQPQPCRQARPRGLTGKSRPRVVADCCSDRAFRGRGAG